MDDFIEELIQTKMKIAESEDKSLAKSKQLKEITEKLTANSSEIEEIQTENESLLQTIAKLIEEKNTLRTQFEEKLEIIKKNSTETTDPEEEDLRSLNINSEIRTDEDKIKTWTNILANWEKVKKNKRIKLLSKKGIPSKLRGEVWGKVIGNNLYITPQLYGILQSKFAQQERDESTLNIPADIRRNLSSFQSAQREKPLFQTLQEILEAFIAYRPDTGYVQGMAYLASILVIYLDDYKSFECLANIIFKSEILRTFYSFDLPGMQSYYRVFEHYMKKYVPTVYDHFDEIGITPDLYLLEWVYTLFSRCFSVEIVSRVWDSYLFEGDAYIFKVGIGILISLEKELQGDMNGIISIILNTAGYFDDASKLFRYVDRLNISLFKINKLRDTLRVSRLSIQ
ncbi:TBC1D12_1 [Blepharisma stoltei]|uniref:Rab-GAP TBC domain-containing protein n=1 Tax=Blepharisma stoltei TaxID=1481888 RepID=A0AAU9J6H8_9CILI|nr:unnamed protein product [Blepharisma stoltei]